MVKKNLLVDGFSACFFSSMKLWNLSGSSQILILAHIDSHIGYRFATKILYILDPYKTMGVMKRIDVK